MARHQVDTKTGVKSALGQHQVALGVSQGQPCLLGLLHACILFVPMLSFVVNALSAQ